MRRKWFVGLLLLALAAALLSGVALNAPVTSVPESFSGWGEAWRLASQDRHSSTAEGERIFIVDSSLDDPDADAGDGACQTTGGVCTLRAAIEEATALPGHEAIHFNVREEDGSCPNRVLIEPDAPLLIADSYGDGITIDGYTQCGARPNSQEIAGNARIKVELRGQGGSAGYFAGIRITSPRNQIRGLAIYDFNIQLHLSGGATHNRIEGNFIGTNGANDFTMPDQADEHGEGIHLRYGAHYNIIGCGSYDAANQYVPCQTRAEYNAARNIISGNGGDGIHLEGLVHWNRVVGNYMGLKQDGRSGLRNTNDGIDLNYGPTHNWIGGPNEGERNVISNNSSDGIELSHNSATTGNHITGNYIGTDATGLVALGNKNNGITVEDAPSGNFIYRNVVAGNRATGIRFFVLVSHSAIFHNLIGVGADGVTPLGNGTNPDSTNGRSGILLNGGSQHNYICGNVIAHNGEEGVQVSNWSDAAHDGYGESYFNTITQNHIYDNARWGIHLQSRVNPANGETTYGNMGLAPPVLASAGPDRAAGSACAGCLVELFIAADDNVARPGSGIAGEGKTLAGSGRASESGSFSLPLRGVSWGQALTASATDAQGNTSEFAANITLSGEPPLPSLSSAGGAALWIPLMTGGTAAPPLQPVCEVPGL